MRLAAALLLVTTTVLAPSLASADESAAEWLFPKAFNDWHDSLVKQGITLGATYAADNIVNAWGGIRPGAIHFGRLDLAVDGDLEKIAGWTGATFHADTLWIYGRGMTRNYVGNLATISEIEARPDIRLYEAYLEQTFWGGALDVRVGQQAADSEFFDSQTDDLFVNGTFGWPAIKATNLPAGGPAPPIAVVGTRVKAKVAEGVTAFAAIFNGRAAPDEPGDPQLLDNHGLAWRVHDAPWVIGQVRYDYTLPIAQGLAGNFTPGAWYHFGDFPDQRLTAEGLLIADPNSTGIPAKLAHDYGIFAVIEQTLYRPPSVKEKGVSASLPGIAAFARIAYSPPDRNLIDLYVDGGIGFAGLIPGRPLDRFGVAVAYMHISNDVRQFDLDAQYFSGLATPVRTFEGLIEVIYEAHIKPGWRLEPYLQYVMRPSGGVSNPSDPTGLSRIKDAIVVGLTSEIKY